MRDRSRQVRDAATEIEPVEPQFAREVERAAGAFELRVGDRAVVQLQRLVAATVAQELAGGRQRIVDVGPLHGFDLLVVGQLRVRLLQRQHHIDVRGRRRKFDAGQRLHQRRRPGRWAALVADVGGDLHEVVLVP